MQATRSTLIAELTLSWINQQMRNELSRREQRRAAEVLVQGDWQRHAATVLTFATWGVCWLVLKTFA
ncbi:MAG: hypothetical protein SFV23_03120 [Planctomycetaceae bacterium]|nr:hypothetical protein [Planctomycetaceae bacterium]